MRSINADNQSKRQDVKTSGRTGSVKQIQPRLSMGPLYLANLEK